MTRKSVNKSCAARGRRAVAALHAPHPCSPTPAPAIARAHLCPSRAAALGIVCQIVLVFHQIGNAFLSARRKLHVRDCQLLSFKGSYTGGALGLLGAKWVYGITESVTSAHPSQLGLSQESRSRPLRKSKDQKHSVGILSRKVMPHMAPWSPSLCCMPRHAAPTSPSYTQTQIHKYRPCRKLCWVKIRPATPAHQNLTPVRSRRALTRSRKPPLTSREKCG